MKIARKARILGWNQPGQSRWRDGRRAAVIMIRNGKSFRFGSSTLLLWSTHINEPLRKGRTFLMSECQRLLRPAADETRFIDDYLLFLMARSSHLISSEFHQELKRHQTTVPVWRVLASLVGTTQGETVTRLAELCLIQQPTMTKLLDRMVRDGLVRRNQDDRDRRVVRIELTPKGDGRARELIRLARMHEATVIARHPETEAMALKSLLRTILERLDTRSQRRA